MSQASVKQESVEKTSIERRNKKLLGLLLGLVAMMSVFSFALIPLYNVFCEITGLNGKVQGSALYEEVAVDKTRLVTVELLTTITEGVPWDFGSERKRILVHPGELTELKFFAKNHSKNDMVAQMIPSIAPGQATFYFHKTECFCFDQQPLSAGQSQDMAMKFYVDPDIPKHIHSITMSYVLIDVTPQLSSQIKQKSLLNTELLIANNDSLRLFPLQ